MCKKTTTYSYEYIQIKYYQCPNEGMNIACKYVEGQVTYVFRLKQWRQKLRVCMLLKAFHHKIIPGKFCVNIPDLP